MACEINLTIPRPEHPRPDFMRETFFNLNGTWQFAYDDENEGFLKGWHKPGAQLDKEIVVPFCYQSKMSGIGPTDEIHPVLWYRRSFTVPAEMQGKRILLHFGAVDFKATVFVNGQQVGGHVGGYTPFHMDITHALVDGENDLCVRVEDEPDCTQPRGKQYWDRGLMGCWYTPVSGIWQTVYMEAVGSNAITRLHYIAILILRHSLICITLIYIGIVPCACMCKLRSMAGIIHPIGIIYQRVSLQHLSYFASHAS